MNEILECQMAHMAAVEEWTEGPAAEYWREPADVICIKYQSGRYWYYKKENGVITWW